MLKLYYQLTKPGIIYGNAITAAAGFFLASKRDVNIALLFSMLLGLSLVIGAGCVFNNFLDRGIDSKMKRTQNRALARKIIPGKSAIIFGVVLLMLGIFTLYYLTTAKALIAAALGFFVYVFLYTPLKRKTIHATLVGAIAGATPPVVGYAAVTNRFDAGAVVLFFILVFWQMPHFYAIAIRRLEDYAAAGIPVLPVKKGMFITKVQIFFYILDFFIACAFLRYFKYAGNAYFAVMAVLSITWVYMGIKGFKTEDNIAWAKKMFKFSLIVLLVLSLMLSLNVVLS